MIKALNRLQLKRRGLMSEKTRRKHSEHEWIDKLSDSLIVGGVSYLLFALVLGILILGAPVERGELLSSWGAVFLAEVTLIAGVLHFYINHPRSFNRNGRIVLIFSLMFIHLSLVRIVFGLPIGDSVLGLSGEKFSFLLAPLAFAPFSISILLGRAQALFVTILCSIWGALLVDIDLSLLILVANLMVGFICVLLTDSVRKRSGLIRAGFIIGVMMLIFGYIFNFIEGRIDGVMDWKTFGFGCAVAVLGGVVTVSVVGAILPVIETLFRITTDISWIELADLNHPLLKKMTIEAPGTYHHSLIVANLSEAAAESIGANTMKCRVCSYFHDIGKLHKPEYFIENISDGDNPHDELTPTMSALVITAHVKEGVDMALKKRLNTQIVDVIEQHHGTSMVSFFYRRAIDQQQGVRDRGENDEANEDDIPEVSEKNFRYPGPLPQFKESGIISLADAIESASRTLQKPTPGKITQLVDEIINNRIIEGQLKDCDLTLREITVMGESFKSTLRSMFHNRITYPKDESEIEGNASRKGKEKNKSRTAQNGNGNAKKSSQVSGSTKSGTAV